MDLASSGSPFGVLVDRFDGLRATPAALDLVS